jgi:hypothetical protein
VKEYDRNGITDMCVTYEEKYEQGFMNGYRIGRISVIRKVLIRVIKMEAESSGKPKSVWKKLFKKINFECDCAFLDKILMYLLKEKISIDELEVMYDTIFRTEEEIRDEIFTIYNKNHDEKD